MSDSVSLCWIGIHSWGKWEDHVGLDCKAYQCRICSVCGKRKYRDGPILHKWTEWSERGVTSVWPAGDPNAKYPLYRVLVQERECERCKTKEVRKIEV